MKNRSASPKRRMLRDADRRAAYDHQSDRGRKKSMFRRQTIRDFRTPVLKKGPVLRQKRFSKHDFLKIF